METFTRFFRRGQAAQVAVDAAIDRANLVLTLSTRRRALGELKRCHAHELTDAEMRVAFAQAALDEYDAANPASVQS